MDKNPSFRFFTEKFTQQREKREKRKKLRTLCDFSPFALTWFPQISESGLAWVLLTCLRFLCLFIKSTTRDMEREMAADMDVEG